MNPTYELAAELVHIDTLKPHPRNAREGNVDAIADSLKEFGQFRPIVVSQDGYILAGNHTYFAACQLGWTTISRVEVPLDHHDPQAIRLMLADNRTSELGGYDEGLLLELLESVTNLDATGYTFDDLADLRESLTDPPPGDPDEAPPVRSGNPICATGDLWLLGDHRLVVGDALNPDHIALLCGEDQMAALITDPPYGVDYVGKTKEKLTIDNDWSSGLTDFLTDAMTNIKPYLADGATFYWFTPTGINHLDHRVAAHRAGLQVRSSIVWVKDRFVLGRSDYHARHETILYGWVDGKHIFNGGRNTDDVWDFARPARNEEHPTMKPVALMEQIINLGTNPGARVLDPFGGSGTTLIACQRTNRRAYTIEMDLNYADVICRRFQRQTGIMPYRSNTDEGVTFLSDSE